MNNQIYILGAGGHTRSLINLLEFNNYSIQGIYDNNYKPKQIETINTYKVIGKISDLKENNKLVLSIGDNHIREKLFNDFNNQILINNLIHPKAFLEKRIVLDNSNQIFTGVTINSNVKIGQNNIINTGVIIEHEVLIGNHNHISVGSILCGRVIIGNRCFIGAGAIIIDKIKITDDVIIGANSVVIDNINKSGTYVGNPARRVK